MTRGGRPERARPRAGPEKNGPLRTHSAGPALPAMTMKNRIIASTVWPANRLANNRTASTPLLMTVPINSIAKIIGLRTTAMAKGISIGGHKDFT